MHQNLVESTNQVPNQINCSSNPIQNNIQNYPKSSYPSNCHQNHLKIRHQIETLNQIKDNNSSNKTTLSSASIENKKNEENADYIMVCAYCGLLCEMNSTCLILENIKINKKCVYHKKCSVNNQKNIILNLQNLIQQGVVSKYKPDFKLVGENEDQSEGTFDVQVQLTHPLSNLVYYKSIKKICMNNNILIWNFIDIDNSNYSPNMICFPYNQFKISLNIKHNKLGQKKNTFLVNLKNATQKNLFASTKSIHLQLQIYSSTLQKIHLIQQLNYKYKFSPQYPIIKLNQIQFLFHHSLQQIQIKQPQKIIQQKPLYIQMPQIPIIYNHNNLFWDNKLLISDIFANPNYHIYLQRLLILPQNKHLINYYYENLYYHFEQMILHQNANFTFQVLCEFFTPNMRLNIIGMFSQNFNEYIKDYKGTLSLQKLINFISTNDEQKLLCNIISDQFMFLATSQNSSYFIEALIKKISFENCLNFYHKIINNLTYLSCNSNGIRIVKQIMNKLPINQIGEFINIICNNLDTLIYNMYANYAVQYIFQICNPQFYAQIHLKIAQKFSNYSIIKYSSKVIQKYLSSTISENIQIEQICFNLEGSGIDQMLKNPIGSNILKILIKKLPFPNLIALLKKSLAYNRNIKYASQWNHILDQIQNDYSSKSCKQQVVSFQKTCITQIKGYQTRTPKGKK